MLYDMLILIIQYRCESENGMDRKKGRNQPIKAEAILNQSMHLYIQSTPKEFQA